MEAAALAASAAAAAAKEAALAAAKDATVAAATAKEASAAAAAAQEAVLAASAAAAVAAAALKEASVAGKAAAAVASAAALNAKEAAVTASAAAFNAKQAADVAATAGEATAAVMRASKKRKFHLTDDDDDDLDQPPVNESVDFISRLPDTVLGTIVSLLPTKDGVRTQAISRRWRSAPLNLVANHKLMTKGHKFTDLIKKIISEHPGPARRFSLCGYASDCPHKIEGWLCSQALNKLQELELAYHTLHVNGEKRHHRLPWSLFRVAPMLHVAEFDNCHVPALTMQPKFPCLQQLTLKSVTIAEDALQSMLSGCTALESLELKDNLGFLRLCISSQTLKSLGFCVDHRFGGILLQELFIEEAPCLERLLPLDPKRGPATIRIISAPKLKIFGLVAVGLTTKIHTMRVLVLHSAGPNLVLKNYDGTKSLSIDFAKFFVLNAKVLKEMKITLPYQRKHKWFANQHRLLQIKRRASRGAQIEMRSGYKQYFTHNQHTHDLSMADPFEKPYIVIYDQKCS